MNTKKIASIVAFTMVVLAAGSMNVAAIPQIPEAYWGYAILDGELAPIGTEITVEVYGTGEVVGWYTTQYGGIYAGIYVMQVNIDDPGSEKDEGATNGEPLTWKINGIECSTPAPGTDIAESGKINNYFTIVAHHTECEGDTTPPTVTASLIPIEVGENEGLFKVEFSATDGCDPDPTVTAVMEVPSIEDAEIELKVEDEVKLEFDLEEGKIEIKGPEPEMIEMQIRCYGGITVENGQMIDVEVVDGQEYEYKYEDGRLKIEAPEITLNVTAIDVRSNSATVSVNPSFAPE